MGWIGHLDLHYRRVATPGDLGRPADDPAAAPQPPARTVAHDRHEGPLRVLQSLYPEGDAVCHQVLVHPPGGIVGGDRLFIDARLDAGTHALITTPGATRYYKSGGAWAEQVARLQVGEGARLEWLPLETIAYDGCLAHNRVQVDLAPGAQTLGWDLLVLGLPATGQAWAGGCFRQHVDISGIWIDRASISAEDPMLMRQSLAWSGLPVAASCWFATQTPFSASERDHLLTAARSCIAETGHFSHQSETCRAGASTLGDRLVLVRALAQQAEPVHALFRAVRSAWRELAWGLASNTPRIWST